MSATDSKPCAPVASDVAGMGAAVHTVVQNLEQHLMHLFGSRENQLQEEMADLRAQQAKVGAENDTLRSRLRGLGGGGAAAPCSGGCVDEDMLLQRPPPSQGLLGNGRAARRGASAPTTSAIVLQAYADSSSVEFASIAEGCQRRAAGAPAAGAPAAGAPTAACADKSCAGVAGTAEGCQRQAAGAPAVAAPTAACADKSCAEVAGTAEGGDSGKAPAQGSSEALVFVSQTSSSELGDYDLSPESLQMGSMALNKFKPAAAGRDSRRSSQAGWSRTSRSTRSSNTSAPAYELLPLWIEMETLDGSCSTHPKMSDATHASHKAAMMRRSSVLGSFGHIEWKTSAMTPVSPHRLLWEAVGTMLVLYDLLILPMQIAALISNEYRILMTVVVAGYWTLDVPLSFCVGYYINGSTEVRFRKIASHYMRTWFVPDMVLVTCDWALLAIEMTYAMHDAESLSYLKVGRGLRLLRFVRMVRIIKMESFFGKIVGSFHSEYVLTTLHILKLLLLVVILNHCVACGWYGLGTYFDEFHQETWIKLHFVDTDTLNYRYATSLMWSLCQFTPASIEVFPTNTSERVFSICIIVLAMVVFSSFVSAITEAMTHVRKVNGRRNQQHSELRKYFRENHVSSQLALRVWRYLEQDSSRNHRKRWSDVELFQQLPEVLQMDMRYEVFMRTIERMPFFHHYNMQNPAAMRTICHHAIYEVSLVADQELFSPGQVADKMYFIIDGNLEYAVAGMKSRSKTPSPVHTLSEGQWICEVVLWIRWFYVGRAAAKSPSLLIALPVSKLHEILRQYVNMLPQCCMYGRLFVERANASDEVAEVWGDFDSAQTLAQHAFGGADSGDERRPSSRRPSRERRPSNDSAGGVFEGHSSADSHRFALGGGMGWGPMTPPFRARHSLSARLRGMGAKTATTPPPHAGH